MDILFSKYEFYSALYIITSKFESEKLSILNFLMKLIDNLYK